MAATALTIAVSTEASVAFAPTLADTVNGNSFDNTNGDVFCVIYNSHATNAHTYNFAVQNQPPASATRGYGSLTKTNPLAISVPALGYKMVGPFPKGAYNDGTNLVQVTFSGTGTPNIQAWKGSGLQFAG